MDGAGAAPVEGAGDDRGKLGVRGESLLLSVWCTLEGVRDDGDVSEDTLRLFSSYSSSSISAAPSR